MGEFVFGFFNRRNIHVRQYSRGFKLTIKKNSQEKRGRNVTLTGYVGLDRHMLHLKIPRYIY